MDAASFRERGKQMVDYIADYLETIEHRRVLPEVQPGYLRDMLPNNAPTHAERWEDIMADVERAIMPGVPITLYSCALLNEIFTRDDDNNCSSLVCSSSIIVVVVVVVVAAQLD